MTREPWSSLRKACPHKKGGDELETGCKAQVDVLIDASFTLLDARTQQGRLDKRDQNQIVLEWNGERWLFLSGMCSRHPDDRAPS